ncbi:MAG: hypothetical protein KatS3mg090_0698 [Patescibacteria group bacterium]|nr:MAG: hypothetical protein KatS3mg090_0698 [Patescibacteria group bacterium]
MLPTKFEQKAVLNFIYPYKKEWSQKVFAYVIYDWIGDPIETDVIRPVKYKISKIPLLQMWPDDKYWLLDVLLGKSLEGRFIYGRDNKTVVKVDLKIQ